MNQQTDDKGTAGIALTVRQSHLIEPLGACCAKQELHVEQDDDDGYFSIRCYNCGTYPHNKAYLMWNDADDVIKQLISPNE